MNIINILWASGSGHIDEPWKIIASRQAFVLDQLYIMANKSHRQTAVMVKTA